MNRKGENMIRGVLGITLVVLILSSPLPAGSNGWIAFDDESAARLSSDPTVGLTDVDEKDYAVGDVDMDGDDDLVCVRKQPFTTPGARRNVLFLNENGVLVDRTSDFAVASDVPNDFGFLTPTNDRDVKLVDVTGDGWLDIVTAVTLGDNLPKALSHPRIYRNLGFDPNGAWAGFMHEDVRIPQLLSIPGGQPGAPRFNEVAFGDVDADGDIDLYFVDHDGPGQTIDFNDRILINDGMGFFTDESDPATGGLTAEMLESGFGTAATIADMNGDGAPDIVKCSFLTAPQRISIAYNDAGSPGIFTEFDIIYSLSASYFSVGDLNADGLLDLAITDDGSDRYLLNDGNGPNGLASFSTFVFQYDPGGFDLGFGSQSEIADLDADGFPDVLIADVDLDLPGCNRRLRLFHNQGDAPDVTLLEEGGEAPWTPEGTYDIAILDLDGDLALDMVLGTCDGTEVWISSGTTPPPQNEFIRGDADGDGDFNGLVDAVFLLFFQFQAGPVPPCLDAADADDDGVVNGLVDSLVILFFTFSGGPPPEDPYPECGVDPTNDTVDCIIDTCP